MTEVVTSAAVGFPEADLQRLDRTLVRGWIDALKTAEESARRLRHQLEALDGIPARVCPACGGLLVGRADRIYCSSRCRQRAHRGRSSRLQP